MTSTGRDSEMPPRGDDPRTSIRSLDPVDPATPPPDGSRLLQAVLATPRRTSVPRSGVKLLQLAPVGLVLALVAGVVAVAIAGGEDGGEEQEATMGSGGPAIIHYVVRETWSAPDGSRQPTFTHEHWQLEDGSRARTISHWEGEGPLQGKTSEDVATRTQTLAYRPAVGHEPATIIRYRASDDFEAIPEDPPTFGAPPIGGSPEVGDPRTVPDRLADGDQDVTRLEDTTVRGIAVKRFQVGDCAGSTTTRRRSDAHTLTRVPQRAIVALARDTLTPVRVTYEPCSSDMPAGLDARILEYLSFEELAPTREHLKLLELSPYPGVPVVDGIEIDKAEERDEAGPTPKAVPTPTASTPVQPTRMAPRSGG
jgi:hypothetical protein